MKRGWVVLRKGLTGDFGTICHLCVAGPQLAAELPEAGNGTTSMPAGVRPSTE